MMHMFLIQIAGIVTIGLGLWLLWDPVASEFFALHSAHAKWAHFGLLDGCCCCWGFNNIRRMLWLLWSMENEPMRPISVLPHSRLSILSGIGSSLYSL
ncbi:hypothetical protein COOONC_09064 [Cooperia oncophora]